MELIAGTNSVTYTKETIEILASEDCCIDLPEIVQKVKLNLFSS